MRSLLLAVLLCVLPSPAYAGTEPPQPGCQPESSYTTGYLVLKRDCYGHFIDPRNPWANSALAEAARNNRVPGYEGKDLYEIVTDPSRNENETKTLMRLLEEQLFFGDPTQ